MPLNINNDKNFRSEVNNKCSDLKNRIRLNLGTNEIYRQQMHSLIEHPEKQIWSDVNKLELKQLAGLIN